MRDRIGVAIIGATGMAGTGHLAGYRALPDVEVRAIWDLDRERARALARDQGIPHVAEQMEAAWDRSDVDIVSICTPDHLHADQAIAALAAGKHVHVREADVHHGRGRAADGRSRAPERQEADGRACATGSSR